ncbi:MAG: GDSL-type esterase/lipase family protein [Clostridiales bacterium]|nr:GDSL-type esterase/lipase family protein [Clostridiales bacterium]
MIILAGIAALVSLSVIVAAAVMNQTEQHNKLYASASSQISSVSESSQEEISSTAPASSKPVSSAPASSIPVSSESPVSSQAVQTEEISSDAVWAGTNYLKTSFDFSKPVDPSKPVDNTYFNDAAIIGDSRAVGLINYTALSNVKNYAYRSATTSKILEDTKLISGKNITVMQDMAANKDKYKKVYIMLGLNEISWPNYNTSKAKYHTMIDQIRASQTDVQIYLQAVMPIGKYAETHHSYLRMEKIEKYNEMLKTVAVDKKVYYIDPASAVAGKDGWALDEAVSKADGYHFQKPYCVKWLDFLKTHTVQ